MALTRGFVEQTGRAGSRVNRLGSDEPCARDVLARRFAMYCEIQTSAPTQDAPPHAEAVDAALSELSATAQRAFNQRWAARVVSRAVTKTARQYAGHSTEVLWRAFEQHTLQPLLSNNIESTESRVASIQNPQAEVLYGAAIVQRNVAETIINEIRRTVYHDDLIESELRVLIHSGEVKNE